MHPTHPLLKTSILETTRFLQYKEVELEISMEDVAQTLSQYPLHHQLTFVKRLLELNKDSFCSGLKDTIRQHIKEKEERENAVRY